MPRASMMGLGGKDVRTAVELFTTTASRYADWRDREKDLGGTRAKSSTIELRTPKVKTVRVLPSPRPLEDTSKHGFSSTHSESPRRGALSSINPAQSPFSPPHLPRALLTSTHRKPSASSRPPPEA